MQNEQHSGGCWWVLLILIAVGAIIYGSRLEERKSRERQLADRRATEEYLARDAETRRQTDYIRSGQAARDAQQAALDAKYGSKLLAETHAAVAVRTGMGGLPGLKIEYANTRSVLMADGSWEVVGTMVGPNVYGVLIREQWTCKLYYRGGTSWDDSWLVSGWSTSPYP